MQLYARTKLTMLSAQVPFTEVTMAHLVDTEATPAATGATTVHSLIFLKYAKLSSFSVGIRICTTMKRSSKQELQKPLGISTRSQYSRGG